MSALTLTCHCRFCGNIICYSRDNIGLDARCPGCGDTIRLPGKLATVAAMRMVRQRDRLGIALEVAGFVCMFFFFPWGLILGAGVVYAGWRRSNRLVCSTCNGPLHSRALESCPRCKSKFGME